MKIFFRQKKQKNGRKLAARIFLGGQDDPTWRRKKRKKRPRHHFLEGLGFQANGAERLKKNRRTRKSPTSGLACLVEGHFDFFFFDEEIIFESRSASLFQVQ